MKRFIFFLAMIFYSFCVFSNCSISQKEIIEKSFQNYRATITYEPKDELLSKYLSKDNKCRFVVITQSILGERAESAKVMLDNNLHREEGPQIEYYDNGQRKKEEIIEKGTQGKKVTWHKNGNTQSEASYINGVNNGFEIFWNENGEKISEKNYKNGLLENDTNKVERYIKLIETSGNKKKIESSVSLPQAQVEIEDIAMKYCDTLKQYPENVEQICEPCGRTAELKVFDWCNKAQSCKSSNFYTISFTCTSSGGYDNLDVNNKIQEKEAQKIIERNEKSIKVNLIEAEKKKKIAKEKVADEKSALIKNAKEKCEALGFEMNTPKNGKCVLELIK
jgi:hypothetical protein